MFYPKIGDYVLLRDGRVARIAQERANVVFSIEVLPNLCPATCSRKFIVKILPPVNLDNLRLGDKVRLASGRTWEVNGIDYPTDRSWFLVRLYPQGAGVNYCRYNRAGRNVTISTSDQSFNIVEIIPQVDLHTLKAGDTVELASGATKEIKSVAYSPLEKDVQVVFTTCKSSLPWHYNRNGTEPYFPMDSIVKIIPKPKLNLYALELGAVVTLANSNTKEVLKVDLQSRAHTSHVCITFADGAWIYNSDGTRPPGRDSAYNVVGVSQSNPQTEPTPLIVNGHTIKPGDRLRLRNGTVITVKNVAWNKYDDNWTVEHRGEVIGSLRSFSYYSNGKNPFNSEFDIAAVVNEPTPLTIGGHVVKPGDVLTRAYGDRIVVDKITLDPCGNWKVRHSAHGDCFFKVDSSGRCHLSPDLTITAVVPNQTVTQGQPGTRMTLERLTQLVEQRPSALTELAQLTGRSVTDLLSDLEKSLSVPWPKPITTPPTKKDADPIRQVAILDKDGDWMQEEWWAARDMLAEGKITGWAHTQAWHDASDPWN